MGVHCYQNDTFELHWWFLRSIVTEGVQWGQQHEVPLSWGGSKTAIFTVRAAIAIGIVAASATHCAMVALDTGLH